MRRSGRLSPGFAAALFVGLLAVSAQEAAADVVAAVDLTPNVLNLKSHGRFITARIQLPPGVDASSIDVSSLFLTVNGTAGASALSHPTEVQDTDGDGTPDRLIVKFLRREVQALVQGLEGPAEVIVGGELLDLTTFAGTDTINVKSPGRVPRK